MVLVTAVLFVLLLLPHTLPCSPCHPQLSTKGAAEARQRELDAAHAENLALRQSLGQQGQAPPVAANGAVPSGQSAAAAGDASLQAAQPVDRADSQLAEQAQQRVFEIRAEAAMLVETVEDRAHEVRDGGGQGRWQVVAGRREAFGHCQSRGMPWPPPGPSHMPCCGNEIPSKSKR